MPQPIRIWAQSNTKERRESVQVWLSRSQLTLMISVEIQAHASSNPSSVVSRIAIPIQWKACWKNVRHAEAAGHTGPGHQAHPLAERLYSRHRLYRRSCHRCSGRRAASGGLQRYGAGGARAPT